MNKENSTYVNKGLEQFSTLLEKVPITSEQKFYLRGDASGFSLIAIYISITSIELLVISVLEILENASWMSGMYDDDYKIIAEHNASITKEKILPKIRECKNEDKILNETFKEIAVSICSQSAMRRELHCDVLPLSELLKERVSGNGGFDFIVVLPDSVVVFGESKYRTANNACTEASKQVIKFIKNGKHISDLSIVKMFYSELVSKCLKGEKIAFAVGYTLSELEWESSVSQINDDLAKSGIMKGKTIYALMIDNHEVF